MNLDSFTGPGSTPSRRKFWDKVTQAVNASQKQEGRNISVNEYQGYGTLINAVSRRGGGAGVCCLDGACTVTTEADCTAMEGRFIAGGICDPNPCCDDCPDPDTPTITVTFAGIVLCSPRTGNLNGVFVLTNTASGIWQGAGNSYMNGGDPFTTAIEVDCTSDVLAITMIDEEGGFPFASSNACPPGPLSNVRVCEDSAQGGTGIISP